MKKSKSLFKTSITAITLLHCVNKYIDSLLSSNYNKKTAGKFYHWKNGDIYYTIFDDKEVNKKRESSNPNTEKKNPLLLIHDLTVFSSSHEWNEIVDKLSERYIVYTLDLIGCGKSDKPEITYTNYFYVQMIHDFIKEIVGEPTKVIATGLSSSFTLMANSIDKNLFTDIIIVNPRNISSLKKTPNDRSKILMKLFSLPVIGKTAYYIATNKQNTEYYLTEKCFYNPFHLKSSVIKAYHNAAHTYNGNGRFLLGSLDGYYVNIDISNALKNAENKITIVIGNHSDNLNEVRDSYIKLNSNIITKIISDAKLLPQLETPEKFINAIDR